MTELTCEAQMHECQLRDVQRRIDNILAVHPRDSWTLDEAQIAIATLSGIFRARQGSIAGLRVETTLVYPAGCVAIQELVQSSKYKG
ncbi:hypothetical protein [Mycobacterium sp. URHD0025]|uniref:hypothetical protein n=1 Tax=Mycobacterium sp. URHD0025 TaxID=1298864 RepID=UPI00048D7DBC|nr:hypothetical protein [Mycobacterium sp. URHD0025]